MKSTPLAYIWSALGLLLFLTGCSSLPTDYPKNPSTALKSPPRQGVAAQLERAAARHPGKSGFAVLEGNREAFTDRIALADFAEETIDVQYYIWSRDTIGLTIGDHLVRAAQRGVRIRFLLDDINFQKRDSAVNALAAHPNINVRIFNPHRYRSLRLAEFGLNFKRLNKRMHNKIMVMDNACAIIGGRNIADEYFGLNENFNNRDLDIAAVGPVVREVSDTFDEFWNSEAAVPIEAISGEQASMEDFTRQIAVLRSNIRPERYPFPLEHDVASLRSRVDRIAENLVWARGEVLFDSFKSMKNPEAGQTLKSRLDPVMDHAQNELLIEAAYFVLRDRGIERMENLVSRGVKVRVLTNSLAGNDVIAAQAGHSKRRGPLVDAGVDLYELRPDASAVLSQVAPVARASKSALHTKALVIDGKKAFVGSYNLDPRSADINSEIGLLVHSEAFARQVEDFLNQGVEPANAYRVSRDHRGRIQWQTTVDGELKTWTKDPETSVWRRAKTRMISLLPIDEQL